ncbi:hypothetical protein AB3Y40_09815 [Yoonia sp. R2331]|uniref:hypothetical protein n=1 Tax=Yoonia sp. R2331 TaxID=3237238 RepID=UPI0034E44F8F
MIHFRMIAPLALAVSVTTAQAQTVEPAKVEALFDALGLPEMMQIMREEGVNYGAEIGEDLFDGRASVEWTNIVSGIYDADAMQTVVLEGLTTALEGDDVDAMIAFFSGEPGQTIIGLELSARRALLDETVEEAAKEVATEAMLDNTDRYQKVRSFIEINDLVETNVVGAMNSNYAFYTGLMDGGALPQELTEDQVLNDVWSQEPEIRVNTTEWVYSFLMLAYQPLSDADLDAYIAFSETEAGQDLNAAMFAAFDGMFEDISRALGLGSAQFMTGQDI